MKVFAVIAEYNPFHNGHLKQLNYIKNQLKADKIVIVMSGNFTQRGSMAVLNKYERARHAILGGADMVLELPTVFATANAEVFAKGAIKLLKESKIANAICFGVESGTKEEYLTLADIMLNESKELKALIKQNLKDGKSYITAKQDAVLNLYKDRINAEILQKPNNILGLEYVKTLNGTGIDFMPIIREEQHSDILLKNGVSSATAIRNALYGGNYKLTKNCLPKYVFTDLNHFSSPLDQITLSAVIKSDKERLSEIADCNEGLENRIKSLTENVYTVEDAVEKIYTKRYTKARIRRILTANLLDITEDFMLSALKGDIFGKILAIKKGETELVKKLSEGDLPIIMRKSDTVKLSKQAQKVFEKDVLANNLFNLQAKKHTNEFYTEIVDNY